MANEKDKREDWANGQQPLAPAPTEQIQTPATPQGLRTTPAQQFEQPVQQGFGGGTLGVNTDLNNPTTPTAAPTEQAPATPAKSATQELIESIKAGSEEERQKIERRRQAEETISGIADMGKALSNLYFTGKGAPNMYDPKTAMTPKARERYERALKNWEKNRAAAMSYALSQRANELKEESNKIAADRNNQLDNYRAEKLRLEAEKQADQRLFKEWENQYKQGMLDVARERAAIQKAYNEGKLRYDTYHTRLNKLAEYEKETTEWRDEKGKHKKEVRKVRNPEGGTTTTTNTTTTPNQGSGNRPKRQFSEIDISK
jgi:hypothetical protein